MGQKVHPVGFRLGTIRTWDSKWYADRQNYAKLLHEDLKIRRFLRKELEGAQVSRINIERVATGASKVLIYAARPGMILGKRCAGLDPLKSKLKNLTGNDVFLNVIEVRRAERDAKLVAENIAQQLVKRVSFRRAMKKAVQSAMRSGALGVKVMCGGRLGGAEMGRREWYHEGRVPLHTLRADIDYATAEAKTTYGIIGVKVWVFRGEVLPSDVEEA
jgi:small subunit ribosomal protein S3